MRRLIVLCVFVAIGVFAAGVEPVVAIGCGVALFLFVAFFRGHFDPGQNKLKSYGFVSKKT